MLSLRNRFGIPGVISVIALVFAMLGGAYAATNDDAGGKATASAKGKPGPRGPRGKTGPAGPVGPPGPQGPAGANGKDGANGSNGSNGANGANGKTILSGAGAPSAALGTDGDFYLNTTTQELHGPKTAGAWGVGTKLKGNNGTSGKTVLNGSGAPPNGIGTDGDFYIDTVADEIYGPKASGAWPVSGVSMVGQEGPPGPTCEPSGQCLLPTGATMTGVWSFRAKEQAAAFATISLPFRVPTSELPPALRFVPTAEQGSAKAIADGCPSFVEEPAAAPGKFCVYEGEFADGELTNAGAPTFPAGVGVPNGYGLVLKFFLTNPALEAHGAGSWAVTR